MKRIGFIGLGIMGSKMAENLIHSGLSIRVFDINRQAVERVSNGTNVAADTIAQVAEGADAVITMLPDSPQVENVVYQEGGLLESMSPGSILIDMSTIAPSTCRKVASSLQEKEISFLDAPVTGGEDAAKNAQLSIFVGGESAVFDRALPLLSVMGKHITRMGEVGTGQTAKICNQITGAVTLQAVCEGLMLGAKCGIDIGTLTQAMQGGAADSFMLEYVSSRLLARNMAPGFKISLEQKDLRNALQTADEAKTPLPALALVHQLFMSREAAGRAETEGNHALFQVYEDLSKFSMSRI